MPETLLQLIFALNVARAIASREPDAEIIVNLIEQALQEARKRHDGFRDGSELIPGRGNSP
jgi:hypothetical protein